MGKEGEDLLRHDKWMCMMYPRLKLLQEAAGRDYRYMMVFAKKDFQQDGAYTLDEFAEVMKKL